MATFTDENKEVQEFNNDYFAFGVHKVQLGVAELDKTDDDKEYAELTVIGSEGEEDKARVWFTTPGAIKYSFNVIRQIIVHNAKTDAAKEKARAAVDAVKTSEELIDLLNEKCLAGELWFSKLYDPKRTYVNAKGETKKSVNKNVYGYQPKADPSLMPDSDGQKPVEAKDYPADEEPFGTKPADKSTVPDNWS